MKKRISSILLVAIASSLAGEKKIKKVESSPLDAYITDSLLRPNPGVKNAGARLPPAPGSLWSSSSPLSGLARDQRASQVDDLVTILVTERASASSTGNTKTSRQSGAKSSIASLAGPTLAKGALSDLLKLSTDTNLQGQGTTTRQSVLTTTLSARVSYVLPNGYLVVEGVKDTMINSERQNVSVRGVVRPADLSPANTISSDRLAQLELRINGKGVVGDAVRRPFFLYRVLLGLLPF